MQNIPTSLELQVQFLKGQFGLCPLSFETFPCALQSPQLRLTPAASQSLFATESIAKSTCGVLLFRRRG